MSDYVPRPMPTFEQGDTIAGAEVPERREELLSDELFPADSYAGDVYWADLPFNQRVSWVNKQSNDEARRELRVLAAEFKKNPAQPFLDYFTRYVITGMGLFVEGYTLFSVGNIKNLLQAVWPQCWKTYQVCTEN